MITTEHIDNLINGGGDILTENGDKIGGIGQIYVDDETGQPSWVTAKTGMFGTNESFVPLDSARAEGSDLVVPYTKDLVKDAPRVAPDGHLEPGEEDRLYRHYQLSGAGESRTGTGRTDDKAEVLQSSSTGTAGAEDAMTRSEERLHVGTEKQETGRVRLRKYVTTEHVTKTVPVQREEVRLERIPVTDENRGDLVDGADLSEEEQVITLHEERPVIEKEAVPVERVRLNKETVTEQHTVNEELRKEQIATDGIENNGR